MDQPFDPNDEISCSTFDARGKANQALFLSSIQIHTKSIQMEKFLPNIWHVSNKKLVHIRCLSTFFQMNQLQIPYSSLAVYFKEEMIWPRTNLNSSYTKKLFESGPQNSDLRRLWVATISQQRTGQVSHWWPQHVWVSFQQGGKTKQIFHHNFSFDFRWWLADQDQTYAFTSLPWVN